MRITFVLPVLNLSGGTRVVFDYAARLASSGHDVKVLIPSRRYPTLRQRAKELLAGQFYRALPELNQSTTKASSHADNSDVPVLFGRDRNGLNPEDFPDADIVIATWWETAEWLIPLPRSKGKKVHFIQDHEIFPYLPVDRVKAVYRLPWPKIVVSTWLNELLVEEYGASDVTLVPNGVNLNQFSADLREKPKLPTVGMLWSMSDRKNSQMGFDAIKIVKSHISSLRANFFGSVPLPPELQKIPWIDFAYKPEQSLIPHIYAACSVWLVPSISEGFGLPLLEAMAMGTPVISTKAGAAPTLVNSANGVLVDCNAKAMADAIEATLLHDHETWKLLSQNSQKTAIMNDLENSFSRFAVAIDRIIRD